MTRMLLTSATILFASALAACSGSDVPEAIDEADSVIIVGDDANGAYLNPARDPEGNAMQGDADATTSTHSEPGTTADNYDVINKDADPED